MKSLLMHGSCLCIIAQALSVCTDLACCVGPSHAMGCVLIGEASQTARQNGTMTEAVTLPKSRGVAQEIMVVEGLLDPSLMPELKGMVQALCEDLPELVEEHKERNLSCTLAESDLAAEKWYEGGISDIVLFLQAAPWLQAEFPQWHLWKCDMLRGWIANGTCARWCQPQHATDHYKRLVSMLGQTHHDFQPLLGAAPPVWPTEPTQGSDIDDMDAALPGEETAAASALVSMNTPAPAAAPRPAAAVLEAEISLLAQGDLHRRHRRNQEDDWKKKRLAAVKRLNKVNTGGRQTQPQSWTLQYYMLEWHEREWRLQPLQHATLLRDSQKLCHQSSQSDKKATPKSGSVS
ncbi:hypothetical protein WJX77_007008 [Trebouxia sp. C0004]